MNVTSLNIGIFILILRLQVTLENKFNFLLLLDLMFINIGFLTLG